MPETIREWKMVVDLLLYQKEGKIKLYQNHLKFLKEMYEYLDEFLLIEEQKSDKDIRLLNWLYNWKINGEYEDL